MTEPLLFEKRDDGVSIVSTNDDPLNRMTLDYVDRLGEVVDEIAADEISLHRGNASGQDACSVIERGHAPLIDRHAACRGQPSAEPGLPC